MLFPLKRRSERWTKNNATERRPSQRAVNIALQSWTPERDKLDRRRKAKLTISATIDR